MEHAAAAVIDPAPEPKVVTPAPEKTASSLNEGGKDEFMDLVSKATTPAQLRAAAEVMRRANQPKPEPTPKAHDPETDGPKPAEPAKEPAVEAKPEETQAEPAKAEEGAETDTPAEAAEPAEADEPDDEDSPITPVSSKNAKVALAEGDELGRLTIAYKKRNRDWTMEQAMEAARKQLGVKPEQADEPAKAKSPSDLPDTIEAVDQAYEALEAQKLKFADELNVAEMAKIDMQLRKLDRQRTALERQGEVAERQQAQEYDTAFAASESKATDLYEFASKPDSPGGKRMIEIEDALRETEDPRYHSPNKPLLIAQMVAAEMNIAPKSKKAVLAKPAAPAPKPAEKKQMLPSGSAKTVPAAPQNGDVAKVQAISTMKDLREFRKAHGLDG
jgi:hypothetical protein